MDNRIAPCIFFRIYDELLEFERLFAAFFEYTTILQITWQQLNTQMELTAAQSVAETATLKPLPQNRRIFEFFCKTHPKLPKSSYIRKKLHCYACHDAHTPMKHESGVVSAVYATRLAFCAHICRDRPTRRRHLTTPARLRSFGRASLRGRAWKAADEVQGGCTALAARRTQLLI